MLGDLQADDLDHFLLQALQTKKEGYGVKADIVVKTALPHGTKSRRWSNPCCECVGS